MAEYEPKNLGPLLTLFNVASKKDAARHCRDLIIHGSDLAAVATASRVGALHRYKYACRFSETRPPHLQPKKSELNADIEVGPLNGEARKLFRKLFQTLEERRVFAAHLLYTEDHEFWHLLYFDQRDLDERRNHWKHGSHIHYVNDAFHPAPLDRVWERVCVGDTTFLKPLHIRFQR